jgi:hypothetical protein
MQSLQFSNLRIPGFVQEDYPKFTSFIKAYYEWLSLNGGNLDVQKFRNIDDTIDVFIEAFHKEYLQDFPVEFIADKRLFLKHNLEFYRSKGSEESLRFLFRLMFDSEIEITYPRDLIFTTSEGIWNSQKSIKIETVDARIFEGIGTYVIGQTSKSIAYIENIYQYVSLNVEVNELFISDIKGQFGFEDVQIVLPDGHIINGTIASAITTFNITNSGLGYSVGQPATVVGGDLKCYVAEVERGGIDGIAIIDGGINYTLGSVITLTDPTGKGIGAELKITGVAAGVITDITIIKRGNGYESIPLVDITGGTGAIITLSSNTIGKIKAIAIENHGVYTGGLPTISFAAYGNGLATVVPVKGSLCTYPGKYNSSKSFISDVNKIQDGIRYQPYSYVIRSGQSIDQYKNILKKLVHPAGMLQLGEIFIQELITRDIHNLDVRGHNGGNLLREIIVSWERIVRSESANLLTSKDVVLFQEVSYTIPNQSNIVNGIDWLYKFQFTTRQIKGFLDQPISNYTFTSDRAFAIVGKAIVGTITVGYDILTIPVPPEFTFIELGNPGRGVAGLGVTGVAIVGSLSGRRYLRDTWGDVIADASKSWIQADAQISAGTAVIWDSGLTTWDNGNTEFVHYIPI